MKLLSTILATQSVTFPSFIAERVYMREFYKEKGLPEDLTKWQPTVDAMLDGVDTDGPIYLMVDCGIVPAGTTHRRKGLHIDGYWNPEISAHGYAGGHGGHRSIHSGHGSGRRHSYEPPSHKGRSPFHGSGTNSWQDATFEEPEGLILASSIAACVGYVGEFEGPIREGGDCSHIDLSGLDPIYMQANTIYQGNVTCLHESLPVSTDCQRQLVRLNVPGWTIH